MMAKALTLIAAMPLAACVAGLTVTGTMAPATAQAETAKVGHPLRLDRYMTHKRKSVARVRSKSSRASPARSSAAPAAAAVDDPATAMASAEDTFTEKVTTLPVRVVTPGGGAGLLASTVASGNAASAKRADPAYVVARDDYNAIDRAADAETPAPAATSVTGAPPVIAKSIEPSSPHKTWPIMLALAFGGMVALASGFGISLGRRWRRRADIARLDLARG